MNKQKYTNKHFNKKKLLFIEVSKQQIPFSLTSLDSHAPDSFTPSSIFKTKEIL